MLLLFVCFFLFSIIFAALLLLLLFLKFQRCLHFSQRAICWHRFFGNDCAFVDFFVCVFCIEFIFSLGSAFTFASKSKCYKLFLFVVVAYNFAFDFHHHRDPPQSFAIFLTTLSFIPHLFFSVAIGKFLFHFSNKNSLFIHF